MVKRYKFQVFKERNYPWNIQGNECLGEILEDKNIDGFPVLDMLRYDNGKIINTLDDSFVVESDRYTKDRWSSFGVKTSIIKEEDVNIDDYKALHERNKVWFAKLSVDIYNKCKNTYSEIPFWQAKDIVEQAERKKKNK